ncbi:MAG: diacylglycerol kinase [Actinobacteria bacterium]|nr:diacylglycerol kinase [Actinomycetota bacterium]
MTIERIALLPNPAAGHGRAVAAARRAHARFAERGVAVTELAGRTPDEARDLAHAAVADGVDALVVAGGDGLIHLALPAVVGTGTPLGVIPAGTGNDQAREYGWPRGSAEQATDLVVAGRVRTVDVGRATTADGRTSYFGSVLASGFDSLVSDRTNRMRWPHGRARYNVAMLAEFVNLRPLPFVITLADGRRIERDLLLVAVGNTRSYGGGMRIAPDADPADGLLDVTIGGAAPRRDVLRLMPLVYRGTHVRRPEVEVVRTTSLRIESPGINAYADGEPLGPLPADVEVVPSALTLIA